MTFTIGDKYLHYLIFSKYLGNDIKDKKYLFVNLEDIGKLYDESYQKVLRKIEKEENKRKIIQSKFDYYNTILYIQKK